MERIARYHLPGLFEFYDLYKAFLPIYRSHRDWFYADCDIASIYGAPADALWGGGRVGFGDNDPKAVKALVDEYGISARLTFSNSLLTEAHLSDAKCNAVSALFNEVGNGVIVHSDLLLEYMKERYPSYYFVSSTTKVLTDFGSLKAELDREEFKYVVPDFRLNKSLDRLVELTKEEKDKIELLANECCYIGCTERKQCYENVSRKSLGEDCPEHVCHAPNAEYGYRFSRAMANPSFIGLDDIRDTYLPMGITNFKLEGRSLGSAVVLEMLLYYLTKPEHQLEVREEIYLDSMLDLF